MTLVPARRASEIEIMDTGDYEGREIRSNLADLRRYNSWFGGTRLIIREVARVLRLTGDPQHFSVLDVATGSADIPARVARWGARRARRVTAMGLDSNPDVLAEAGRRHGAGPEGVILVQADAVELPWRDRAIDLVICSNFMHHLNDTAASRTLEEMSRVARRGVVMVDLVRTRTAWSLVWLLTRLTTSNRLTRHDGPLSVSRAFTCREMSLLADRAGLHGARCRQAGPVKMVLSWIHPGASR